MLVRDKESKVVEVMVCCRKSRNDSKNIVVKNEVCISYALTDLEIFMSRVTQSKFCGLSPIHANLPYSWI